MLDSSWSRTALKQTRKKQGHSAHSGTTQVMQTKVKIWNGSLNKPGQ